MTTNNSDSTSSVAEANSARQCAEKILQVIPVIAHFLRDEVREYGKPNLSLSQLRILCFLERHPESSLSEIAEYIDVTRPTMSQAIERLVKQGYVKRVSNPQERRQVLLSLTSTGDKYQQQVQQALLARIEQKLTSLDDKQDRQVIEVLSLLETIF